MGETKWGWLARASSTLRNHLCTQPLSLLVGASIGWFDVPALASSPKEFSFWSLSAEISCESLGLASGAPFGSWAAKMQGRLRSMIPAGKGILLISNLFGQDSLSVNGMRVVLQQYCGLELACNVTHCVVIWLCARWNPGHRRSSLPQSSSCYDQGPFRRRSEER